MRNAPTTISAFMIVVSPISAFAACSVTKDQYAGLQMKMTYAEATTVLGCRGEEVSSSEIAGFRTEMYSWAGKDLGTNMNAMFQNGRLINKAQFGLK